MLKSEIYITAKLRTSCTTCKRFVSIGEKIVWDKEIKKTTRCFVCCPPGSWPFPLTKEQERLKDNIASGEDHMAQYDYDNWWD